MKKTQKGFAVVESLLIILILVIIGFGGYYVWQTQQQTNKTLDQASATSQKTAATKPLGSSGSKYLTINEWGVKIPLTEPIADAYYVLNSDRPDVAYVSLGKYKNTECSAENTTVAAYFRFTADEVDQLGGTTYLSERPDSVKIGNYYYSVDHPQAACSTTSSNAEPTQADVDAVQSPYQAFVQAIAKVQAE
jgi:hypothetical protein